MSAQPVSFPPESRTEMTIDEMKDFVRKHFDDLINKRKLEVCDVNFSEEFVEHGADMPPGLPPGREGTRKYVGGALERFPDLHVDVQDVIAEGDRVVVRNTWTGTDRTSGKTFQFSGIVIWRIANRQLAERWAYLEAPREIG